jgi:hypothetical protein
VDPFTAIRAALDTCAGDREAPIAWVQDWLRRMTGEEDA